MESVWYFCGDPKRDAVCNAIIEDYDDGQAARVDKEKGCSPVAVFFPILSTTVRTRLLYGTSSNDV